MKIKKYDCDPDQAIREYSKKWSKVCRGFVQDQNGNQKISVYGEQYTGYWAYGYYFKYHNTEYILGGTSLADIGNSEERLEIVPFTACRCTGWKAYDKSRKNRFPLFEYDLVSADVSIAGVVKTVEYHFDDMLVYWNSKALSWGIMPGYDTDDIKSYPISTDWDLTVKGTLMDV